jgi:hypothetical protein
MLHAGFLLRLFLYPEDGGHMIPETSLGLQRTKQLYIPEDYIRKYNYIVNS